MQTKEIWIVLVHHWCFHRVNLVLIIPSTNSGVFAQVENLVWGGGVFSSARPVQDVFFFQSAWESLTYYAPFTARHRSHILTQWLSGVSAVKRVFRVWYT